LTLEPSSHDIYCFDLPIKKQTNIVKGFKIPSVPLLNTFDFDTIDRFESLNKVGDFSGLCFIILKVPDILPNACT
jgi:hypothetical protein